MKIETLYNIKNLSLAYRYLQFSDHNHLLNYIHLRKRKA